jgi:FkbM family methyltransferase
MAVSPVHVSNSDVATDDVPTAFFVPLAHLARWNVYVRRSLWAVVPPERDLPIQRVRHFRYPGRMYFAQVAYRQAARLLPRRPVTLPLLAGPLWGRRFCANYAMRPQYLFGSYERPVIRWLSSRLRPGMVVYDVGANVGYLSAVMSRAVGPTGAVYAFEPSPHAYSTLAVNAVLAGFHASPIALADVDGEEVFSDFEYDLVSRLGDHSERFSDARLITAQVRTADRLIEQGLPSPHFVKIDVEGAEARVLDGMDRTLKTNHPTLLIELHSRELERAVNRRLRRHRYSAVTIRRQEPVLVVYS